MLYVAGHGFLARNRARSALDRGSAELSVDASTVRHMAAASCLNVAVLMGCVFRVRYTVRKVGGSVVMIAPGTARNCLMASVCALSVRQSAPDSSNTGSNGSVSSE